MILEKNTYATGGQSQVSLASGFSSNGNYLYKTNGVVMIALRLAKFTVASTGWIIIGTLPDGYRPKSEIDVALINNLDDTAIHGRITANGNISIWASAVGDITPYISCTFLT